MRTATGSATFSALAAWAWFTRPATKPSDIDVALKVLRDQRDSGEDTRTLDRFQQELILARQVSHRNVVRIHDIGQDEDVHFLTMDLITGRSLKEILDERGTLPVAKALELTRQIAGGLAAAHEMGVTHRDLKPANILVDADDVPYITDFGVARSANLTGLTMTGHIVGTPDYLSPEQARGMAVDGRSDIYSLGLILYEMLSGQLPFSGETYQEVLAQRTLGKPRDLAELGIEVPASVRRIIDNCLASNPDDRYQEAAELAADLGAGRATQALVRHRSRLARRVVTWAAVVVLGFGGVGLISWLVYQRYADPAAASATTQVVRTIAILPLEDGTGRPELAWLRNGLPELATDRLAENRSLQFVDPTRVVQTLKDLNMLDRSGSAADIQQAAELLGANLVVTGDIRTAGEMIRVDATIIGVGQNRQADRQFMVEAADAGEAFLLVNRFAETLLTHLAVDDQAPAPEARLSDSQPALQAYAEGVRLQYLGNSVAAAPLLEQAVELDAGFVAAWLRLSEAYDALGYDDKAVQAIQSAGALLKDDNSRIALEVRAQDALLGGDLERAQAVLTKLVARYPGDSESRVALALAYENEGKLAEAMSELDKVISDDPNNPRAWFLMGKYAILTGSSQAAIDDYLVRALVIQNRLGNEQGRADVMNAMGIAFHQLGELDQAEEQYRLAAALRTQIGDQRGVASSLTNLARISVGKSDFAKAREQFTEAMQNREAIGDTAGLAVLENELGLLEEHLGDYHEALKHFRKSLNIRRQLGDKRALSESYSNVGFAYYSLGEYDNASVYWQQALDNAVELGNREDIVLATQNMGLLAFARGSWEESLKAFLSTLEEARKMANPFVQAVAMGNLGRIAMYQGRYTAAFGSLDDAIALLAEQQDERGQAEYMLFKTDLLLQLNMRKEARGLLDQVGELLQTGGSREQLAELRRLQGELAVLSGDRDAAEQSFASAVELSRASGNPVIRLRAELGAGKSGLLGGQDVLAAIDKLNDEADLLGNIPLQLQALELASRAALASGRDGAAEKYVRRLLKLLQTVGVYEGSWRAHALLARSLLAQGDSQQAALAQQEAGNELRRVEAYLEPTQLGHFRQLQEIKDFSDDT